MTDEEALLAAGTTEAERSEYEADKAEADRADLLGRLARAEARLAMLVNALGGRPPCTGYGCLIPRGSAPVSHGPRCPHDAVQDALSAAQPDVDAWRERVTATARAEGDAAGFARGVEAAAKVCDGYGREGDRLAKEYANETADELAARIRALIGGDDGSG